MKLEHLFIIRQKILHKLGKIESVRNDIKLLDDIFYNKLFRNTNENNFCFVKYNTFDKLIYGLDVFGLQEHTHKPYRCYKTNEGNYVIMMQIIQKYTNDELFNMTKHKLSLCEVNKDEVIGVLMNMNDAIYNDKTIPDKIKDSLNLFINKLRMDIK